MEERWGTSFLIGVFNTLRPRDNGRHFADNIFKRIFFNENVWISIKVPLKFVPKGLINNIPALVQITAPFRWQVIIWMLISMTHICVTRPQWVKSGFKGIVRPQPITYSRDHSGYGCSEWETKLHYNVISRWLLPYSEWTLLYQYEYGYEAKDFFFFLTYLIYMYASSEWLIIIV